MSDPIFTFRVFGRFENWWALRAPTWSTACRDGLDAQRFENRVLEWLIHEAEGEHHLANGDAQGYPQVFKPYSTGNGLCLLLKDTNDLLRFGETFTISGLNPAALAEPIQL